VLIVDTNGQVASGVTTYPATIVFDTSAPNIYPNMSVNADIITNVKDNVILVPSGAIQTSNNQSTVQILKNGKPTDVTVELGDSNDTQTEIVSGVSEGDLVVTNVVTKSTTQTSGSAFSIFGCRGLGGGAAARPAGR